MQKRRSVADGQHSRRAFVARMASATAGMLVGGGLGQAGWRALQAQGAPGPRRREVSIDGRRVTYGTDYPFDWPVGVDFVLDAPFLNSAEKAAILGGTLGTLLRIG